MKCKIQVLIVVMLTLLQTACAPAPKVALRPEAKQSIKRIALAETPEPQKYFVHPGATPAAAGLYLFGAIGGAIVGGIEARRQIVATDRFTSAVAPLHPALSSIMVNELEQGLKAKGYDVSLVPIPPHSADGKGYDLSSIKGTFDAVLLAELNAGYVEDSSTVVPRVFIKVSLQSNSGQEKLFADSYIYSHKRIGELEWVETAPELRLPSVEAIYENVGRATEGMKIGTKKLTERVLADL